MNISLWLLTAACATGQVESPDYVTPTTPPMTSYARPYRPSFFELVRDRVSSWMPSQRVSYPGQVVPMGMAQPQMMTAGRLMTANGIIMVSNEEAAAEEPPVKVQLSKEYQNKVGRSEDFKWVTGQLFYVHVDGGRWVLRYASLGEADEYGGSIVLAPAVSMKNFREGDLVSVSGHLLGEGRANKQLGGPLYRVETIDMVDRAD